MQKCGFIEKSLAVQEDRTSGRAVKPAATTEALELHAPQQEKHPQGEARSLKWKVTPTLGN